MKKWFTKSNLFTLIIVAVVVFLQAPSFLNNIQQSGNKIVSQEYEVITSTSSTGEKVLFPPQKRSIAIFWASWCAPCKLEMARLKSSVENGTLAKESVFAINPFEEILTIRKFLAQNDYPFTFINAPGVAQDINVQATPTTIFIDENTITSMSSGMSLTGIWRAEFFLRK